MSASSPCAPGGACLPSARALLAPLAGLALAVLLAWGASAGWSAATAGNTHLPPERLAEVEAMLAGR